ncbi:hypothetical protein DAEQUDRAFT_83969 [Daedalea quercina L-15889]|uniref:Uncharacterized protein n=1 Tax=Daedalea quercina L-15889 TaxID=1314783 RepID=A0A165L3B4_9APHY|nr:hypothetical protein DAEQUDRAFT_83969 [Daedalea quercina L-15889]
MAGGRLLRGIQRSDAGDRAAFRTTQCNSRTSDGGVSRSTKKACSTPRLARENGRPSTAVRWSLLRRVHTCADGGASTPRPPQIAQREATETGPRRTRCPQGGFSRDRRPLTVDWCIHCDARAGLRLASGTCACAHARVDRGSLRLRAACAPLIWSGCTSASTASLTVYECTGLCDQHGGPEPWKPVTAMGQTRRPRNVVRLHVAEDKSAQHWLFGWNGATVSGGGRT